MAYAARQGSLSARQPEKPRLPQLHGIVNRRAQQIIMDHMHCSNTEASFSSTATVPVLMQIDSTAPKTARTHDISHLRDQKEYLTPSIPASLIDAADHIYETGFLPKDSTSVYYEQDGLWYTKVFPSNTPSSRTDAVMLDAWVTKTLESYKKTNEREGSTGGKENLALAVEELVPVLSVALHEIVRQVTHHCTERGTVLEKIWRTYVELFDRVLHEMQAALKKEKHKTLEIHDVLMGARNHLDSLKRSHPEQMQNVIGDLEAQFTERQKEVEDELIACEQENHTLKQELRTHYNELELWYPSFALYQDSYLKNHIPHYSHHTPASHKTSNNSDEETPAEVAIAEDFKRLLAVLAPEKRQAIGKELTFVLKTSSVSSTSDKDVKHGKGQHKTRLSQIIYEGQRHCEKESKLASLHEEVARQEMKIQDLKNTVEILEREEAEANKGGVHPNNVAEAAQDGDGVPNSDDAARKSIVFA